MKKITLIASVAALLLAACGNPNLVKVTGTFKDKALDGKTVFLRHNIGDQMQIVDSVKVTGENFEFSFESPNEDVYSVDFESFRIDLLAKNGESMKLTIDNAATPFIKYEISGSEGSEAVKKIYDYVIASQDKIYTLQNGMRAQTDTTGMVAQIKTLQDEYEKTNKWIRNEAETQKDELLKVYAAGFLDAAYDNDLLVKLGKEIKNENKNAYLSYFITRSVAMSKLAIGAMAPEIVANTPEGKEVKLSDFKGKYVLVDFWASWCGPCRKENPNVVKIYNKYHAKGFEILGVSLDKSADKWKEAIAADGLTWTHISELKQWESKFVADYNIEGIPATYLIDKEGKIYAKNLRGEELETFLAQLYSEQK